MLLNDGLMVLVTVPNEYYQVIMNERNSVELKAVPEPGIVIIRVGKVVVSLPATVFKHVVETGKVFVYLSDYDSYVMQPWAQGSINAAELWTVKGVADYLVTQAAPDGLAVIPVVRQIPEDGVGATAAAVESG
ncbi:MAG: hypothetical protein CVU66_02660 [Deltaproteobacteria bacterium HGW-Deltaproteobacteria-23]|nr:MAG: hypothetical protein CVU66_02660 [Deltaproteobacteria bacterium HGW-Deltaproteobacteria-23]